MYDLRNYMDGWIWIYKSNSFRIAYSTKLNWLLYGGYNHTWYFCLKINKQNETDSGKHWQLTILGLNIACKHRNKI
jgi:hypothetical protein